MTFKAGLRAISSVVGIALLLGSLVAYPADALAPPVASLLVKVGPHTTMGRAQALASQGLAPWEPLALPGWYRVRVPRRLLPQVKRDLQRDPTLLAVQEDHRVQLALTPNDTGWSSQWGPAKIGAPAGWELTTGRADVVVAVLDTGVQTDHPDLAGQLWVNPGEIAANGIDDDGNGQVDDIHGWAFCHKDDGSLCGQEGALEDDYGHGTHVAGIVAAKGNNGFGVAGMAWDSRVMVLKILDSTGFGWESDVLSAVVYAVDNGARILNLSLGGAQASPLMEDAVNYAATHGALAVAAAGNYSSAVLYPAAYPNAVAVAATDSADQRASYSAYGPEVDLSAPGTSIYSTCWGTIPYCYKSGTSMATPHVAGLAALIWSLHPEYTAFQVRQQMTKTAQDVEAPGWDQYTGWGRIDVQRALSTTLTWHVYYYPFVSGTAPTISGAASEDLDVRQ